MGRVAIIGVGQSTFVRSYPGSLRELAFVGFKEAITDAGITAKEIDASVFCSAPEYDKQRSPSAVIAEYCGLNPQPTFYVETLCLKLPAKIVISASRRDTGQRVQKGCGCKVSVDIGVYHQHPCYHNCLFCYANPTPK